MEGLTYMLTKAQYIALATARLQSSFDAADSVFLANELQVIESEIYKVRYPNLVARSLIPVRNAGSGIQELGYDVMDMQGKAKIIGEHSKDIPQVDISKDRVLHIVRSLADSYTWSYFEMEKAARAKMALSAEKAMAAHRAMEVAIDDIGINGDSLYKVPGFFSDLSLLTQYTLPADGTGSLTKLRSKTPDKVIRDVSGVINAVSTTSLGIFKADTFLCDLDTYTYIATTPRSDGSDLTILKFLQINNPGVDFVPVVKLGAGNLNLMAAYYRSPEVLTFEIPKEFTQLPVQVTGLDYIVNCVAQIAGVFLRQPKSIVYASGVK